MTTPTREQIDCRNCTMRCRCYHDHLKDRFKMLTAPQIPTKEELYKVGYKVYKKYRPYGKNSTKKWFMEMEKDLWADSALAYITEWEKIKDVDARVEEMCKNNPSIKDFEDFNRK